MYHVVETANSDDELEVFVVAANWIQDGGRVAWPPKRLTKILIENNY